MFTGIIHEKGEVIRKEQDDDGALFQIKSSQISKTLRSGDSVSVDGVCLTVSEQDRKSFTAFATPETLKCTNLGERECGDFVNLEAAANLVGILGGHLVQGHVDQKGQVIAVRAEGNSWIYRISAGPEVLQHCVLKGSVAVNGVSLTVSRLESNSFEVTIIPYTFEATNFKNIKTGDHVNLETDVLSKYVASHVKRMLATLVVTFFFSYSLLFGDTLSLGSKSILIYRSQTPSTQTELIIRLARYQPDIFLEWESDAQQGTLHLHRKAVQRATKFTLNQLFEVGVDMESEDVMTVWLPRKTYRNLLENGTTKVKLNHLTVKFRLSGRGNREVTIDGESREIPVIHVVDNKRGEWTFHQDEDNPVLVEYSSPYYRQFLRIISTASTVGFRWIKNVPPVR